MVRSDPLAAEDSDDPDAAETPSSAGFSQSLARGLQILTSFTELHPVLGIADIARAVDLTKSTTLSSRSRCNALM